jgi:D-hydroxyproline dehydrogenase subunit beta
VTAGLPSTADVVVVGAGIVGAACAYFAARAGLRVVVVDARAYAGGTSSAGEGNLLISDKRPGPELELMRHSLALWRELAGALDGAEFELDPKGGLVVAATAAELAGLRALGAAHRTAGLDVRDLGPDDLAGAEPYLAPGLAGGALYPQDAQVQPMLAAAHLLRAAVRRHGASLHCGVAVTSLDRDAGGRVRGVGTGAGPVATAAVVNAAGLGASAVAALAGVTLPVAPRRGFILVTEPLPPMVRHKVYAADYMAAVASDDGPARTSPVVEGTRAGTVLIGSSRELVGLDATLSPAVLSRLARQGCALFPALAGVHALRAYVGFRPFTPDHAPVIGADPRAPGLVHACGHEGAGIGLAPATGAAVAAVLTGAAPTVDLTSFRPERFADAA